MVSVTHYRCGGPMWPWRKDGTCQTCGEPALGRPARRMPGRPPLLVSDSIRRMVASLGRKQLMELHHAVILARLRD